MVLVESLAAGVSDNESINGQGLSLHSAPSIRSSTYGPVCMEKWKQTSQIMRSVFQTHRHGFWELPPTIRCNTPLDSLHQGCDTSFNYLDRYPRPPLVFPPGKSVISSNMRFSSLITASMASVVAGQGLTQTLMNQPSLSNLTTYLQLFPTLLNELSSMTNITLLAPSNMAFETALNSSTGAAFTANNTDVISALFSYHVLNGTYTNFSTMPEFVHTALMPGMYANVTGGQAVEVLASSNMTNATVTFYSGLLQNSSVATNGTFNFTGGVVHVVDHFLVMPENLTNTAVQLNLRSAVGALTTANLADTLDTMMDTTFFVPDNAAFQAIGSALATSTPQDLARILQYHVVNGTVGYSSMLTNGTTLTTMDGIPVTITIDDGDIFVNSARVVTQDVLVANGVMHVIDGVLNPGNRTAVAQPTASTQQPAFSGASSASDTPFTSGVATATTTVNTEGPTSAASAAATGGGSSSSSGGAMPMKTGAMGVAALFGGAAAIMNL
ncbi:hypothetical protein LTR20_006215 [Exophiala xenobiotica]|nr:hypothetical protein LTR41_007204 [Exophiala xenobiotica]KAK5369489.1 hypothetical protein LTS13_007212 [Exophiala xenobiotica]KAK5395812.1 hypothetical protein LTR79_006565 [Exophiala xenobiotica]KAK5409674.1 hypothetical protein LTR90_008863 [Exophiala xenobiotica]KAK5462265.1 hypothetical protein LTR20_006215 [Exophiala xenobiotica]